MLIKIVIYFIIIFGTLFLERQYQIVQTTVRPDLFYVPIYIIAYLLLLGLELRSKISKKGYKSLKRTGFVFSFWVGVSWGVFITCMKGYPNFSLTTNTFSYALGVAIIGLLVGGLGTFLTPLYLKYVFGENRNEGIDE
jgi:hypothetical protein